LKAPYKKIVAFDIKYPQEDSWQTILEGTPESIIESGWFIDGKLIV